MYLTCEADHWFSFQVFGMTLGLQPVYQQHLGALLVASVLRALLFAAGGITSDSSLANRADMSDR